MSLHAKAGKKYQNDLINVDEIINSYYMLFQILTTPIKKFPSEHLDIEEIQQEKVLMSNILL